MGDSQVISLILLCFAGDPEVPFQPVRAEVRYVHDADTLNVDICLPFKVTLPNRTVRAWGYDAWETNRVRKAVKVTEAEIKKGLQARSEFMELLKEGVVYVEDMESVRVRPDPYGRLLCRIWVQKMTYPDDKPTVEWIYVPKWMEQHGHIRAPRNE